MGLILPRSPLVYPGGQPGFDQNHLASKGVVYSAVASTNGGLIVVQNNTGITGQPTITGTVTTRVSAIGPVINATTAANNFISVGSISSIAPVRMTVGFIVSPTASTSGRWVKWGSATDANELLTSSLVPEINNALSNISSSITLTVGHSYFVGASFLGSIGINWAVTDLNTGKIVTSFVSNANGPGTFAGAYTIGGSATAGSFVDIAAFAQSFNNYLTAAQLKQWAQAPWDFWYPPTVKRAIFAKQPTIPGTLAFTEPTETFAFSGSDKNAGTLAITEPTETFAFSGTDVNSGTLTVTEPTETFAFSGTDATTGTLSITEPTETFAFDGTVVLTGTLAFTEPTETFAFDGTAVPPPPQPGPQRLYPLRERTYRRRFLGVGYDPICVITKDRPGPMRIIEFIGEIKDE